MTDTSRYPSQLAAFEAGRKAGIQEERERHTAQAEQHETNTDEPTPLTLEDIRAGKYSVDEIIERKQEVDALLMGEASK